MYLEQERIDKIRNEALKVIIKNRRIKDYYQYIVPAPTIYPYQWLWDSCFHIFILSCFNIEDAKKEIESLFSHQFENGMLPHMIYWEKSGVVDIKWGKDDTSSITQPPLIAEAIWQVYEKEGDKEFLKKYYPNLYHFYNYLLLERDPQRGNLVGIINPDESGEDNSPRFDELLSLPFKHTIEENQAKRNELVEQLKSCNFDAPFCMKEFFWVKDVPFNAILVKNLEILSKISKEIGFKDEAIDFMEHSQAISKTMHEKMFEDGLFWSTKSDNDKKIKVKTWSVFMPLYANILSKAEARKLVDQYLLDPNQFLGLHGIRTVSKDEKSYDQNGFWRGPVWIGVHWFIYRGLLNYDMKKEADDILKYTIELLEKSGFREYFNPETGKGLGANDFTWGALVADMIRLNERY